MPMFRFIDLTGQRFGRLVVISRAPSDTPGARFVCRCDCGTEKIVSSAHLRSGSQRSCGCYRLEILSCSALRQPQWQPIETGTRFGRWTALENGHRSVNGRAGWLCRCDCGQEKAIASSTLWNGDSTSCGCYRREVLKRGQDFTRHGHSSGHTTSRTYRSWMSMKARCYRPSHENYKHYGGRGITVCDRWRDSFADFLADLGERPAGQTLDRIDNAKGYELGNVRWATPHQQNLNRRVTIRRSTLDGQQITIAEIAHILALPLAHAYYRFGRSVCR